MRRASKVVAVCFEATTDWIPSDGKKSPKMCTYKKQ